MEKFNIVHESKDGKFSLTEVNGRFVKYKSPFDKWKFFIFYDIDNDLFSLTEFKTGARITSNSGKHTTIEFARGILINQGPDSLKRAIKKARKEIEYNGIHYPINQ